MKTLYAVKDKQGKVGLLNVDNIINIVLYQALSIFNLNTRTYYKLPTKKEHEIKDEEYHYLVAYNQYAIPVTKNIMSLDGKCILAVSTYAYEDKLTGFYIGHKR